MFVIKVLTTELLLSFLQALRAYNVCVMSECQSITACVWASVSDKKFG